jgi:hypothetical protein
MITRTLLNNSFVRTLPVFLFSHLSQVLPKPISTLGWSGQSMNVTIRLQMGQRLRKRGAVSPRLHTSSWHASDTEGGKNLSLTLKQRWIFWLHVISNRVECKHWSQICAGIRKDESLLWLGFSLVKYNMKLPWARQDEIWRNGGIAPLILNLGTRWRWVVTYMCLSLYLQS